MCFEDAGNFLSVESRLSNIQAELAESLLHKVRRGPGNGSDLTPDFTLFLQCFRSEECFAVAVACRVELT